MIVVRRSATNEIFSIICSIVDQMLSVVVAGVNRKLVMRSTHLTIVWSTGLVHWSTFLLMQLKPEALSSSLHVSQSSSSSTVWVWSQDTRTSGAFIITEVNDLLIDSAADRELLAHAVAMVVDVLKTNTVREETHIFRDCVDNQPCLAPDIMTRATTPNTHPVREETQNTVDCMVVQIFFAHTMKVVDLLIIRFTKHDIHSEQVFLMKGIMSLNMRLGSNMAPINRIGTSHP